MTHGRIGGGYQRRQKSPQFVVNVSDTQSSDSSLRQPLRRAWDQGRENSKYFTLLAIMNKQQRMKSCLAVYREVLTHMCTYVLLL